MKLRVLHETRYEYGDPVSTSHHHLHLSAREDRGQTCLAHEITIQPRPSYQRDHLDYFGNRVRYVALQESHRSLTIVSRTEVHRDPSALELPSSSPCWEHVAELVQSERSREALGAHEFVFDSPHVVASPDLLAYARPSFPRGRPILDALADLTRRIHGDFVFDPKATDIFTPIMEVLRKRRGVCQDFAHLQIGCLRSLGLPGRYMSGYILTHPPPGKEKLVGADASHAWASSYVPPFGWISMDPTNDLIQSPEHVVIAWGRDFADVTPVCGVIHGGGSHLLHVSVDVSEVAD